MRSYVLPFAVALLSIGALAQDCTPEDFASFSDVRGAVSRLLSFSGYTGFDEKILNRSGDLAAIAVMKAFPNAEIDSPEKMRATFATCSLWAGVDLRTVQQWLGHSDLESTMRYLKPSRSQQVREKVNEIFCVGMPGGF